MKRNFALFALVLAAGASWADILSLTTLVDGRRWDALKAALTAQPLGVSGQGDDPDRETLDWALLRAPGEYLKLFLDHGFDPNAVETDGGYSEKDWESRFSRVTFLYRALTSGRTELLAQLHAPPESMDTAYATAWWRGPQLIGLRVETLWEAAIRMGDADALAFAKTLKRTEAAGLPPDSTPAGSLFQATLNDDNVRLREGPSTARKPVGTLTLGQKVQVLKSGPPRFLEKDAWMDRWFRVTDGSSVGWVWGGFLDLPYDHGQKLAGRLLVDFKLWKQHLYNDLGDRAAASDRWRPFRSLWQWALPLQDKAFVRFLTQKKEPDSISLGEENESLIEWFLNRGDDESLAYWADNGYRFTYDHVVSYGSQAFTALLRNPETRLFHLFTRAGYDFETVRTYREKNGGGDSWGGQSNTALALVDQAPTSVVLELLPSWKNLNTLLFSWESSYSGYSGVRVGTLLDSALRRGDARLVRALKDQGALTRDEVLKKSGVGSAEIPRSEANDSEVSLRAQPSVSSAVVRKLTLGESVVRLDQSALTSLPGNEAIGRWIYVFTDKKEFGWLWDDFLRIKNDSTR